MPVPPSYKRHRFPAVLIARAVWLYFRFPLSLPVAADVADDLAAACRVADVDRIPEVEGLDQCREVGGVGAT